MYLSDVDFDQIPIIPMMDFIFVYAVYKFPKTRFWRYDVIIFHAY